MGKLDGKIALITGGTSGIGLAAAQLFREEGATVIVSGSREASVAAAAALGFDAVRSDAAELDAIAALMAGVGARHGRIDVLFVNAGMPGPDHPVATASEALFDAIAGVNFKGVFFAVQHALPLMPDGAAIVLTSSVGAHAGLAGHSVYAASKAAVRSLARGFAAELMPRGIRVNTLTPGFTDTPIFARSGAPAEPIKAHLATLVPMRRAGQPDELARAALFLASSDASFMTGAELLVAGGQGDL